MRDDRQRAPRDGQEQRRLAGALVVALALHLGLAAWMGRLPVARAPAPKPIEIQLLEIAPPPPAPPPLPPRAEPPPSPPHVARPHRPAPLPPDAETHVGPENRDSSGVAPVTPTATGDHTLEPSRRVDLFAPDALAKSVARGSAANPGGSGHPARGDGHDSGEPDGDGPEAERARVSGRIARDLSAADGAGRVDVGLVDPYFHQLASNVEHQWQPTFETLGKGLVQAIVDARRARALAELVAPTSDASGLAPGVGPSNSFEDAYRKAVAPIGVVVLRLEQVPSGDPVDVLVLVSSGHPSLDASGRDAVWSAARRLGTAPAHGFGLGGDRIRSTWKLEARLGGPGALSTRIELVAIEGGEKGPREAPDAGPTSP